MGKIAFVFSGQGAQHTGMGKELSEQNPAAAEIFRKADAIRPGTSEQCFEGSDEILSVTKNTQPCLYCVDLAAAMALGATVAYYLIFVMLAWIFALFVYYTVKMM